MTIYYRDELLTLLHGRAEELAKQLAPRSVQTIVTSPPYYGLRDYDVDGQTGAEPTVHNYVDRLVTTFAALRDALADDGTVWLNLGDTYAAKTRGSDAGWDKSRLTNPGGQQKRQAASLRRTGERHRGQASGIAAKNLLGVPWRVAFALQDDGWILRSDIVWAKPNPLPESVTDRPTKAHEYLFLFAKQPRYYYDAAAIAAPVAARSVVRTAAAAEPPRFGGRERGDGGAADKFRTRSGGEWQLTATANKRTVWTVPTVPFGDAHFAVYPPELIRPCILAGSRRGGTVLDPFSGSGTTGMVATQEGRRYIGIDINAAYLDLSLRTRFRSRVLDLTGGDAA